MQRSVSVLVALLLALTIGIAGCTAGDEAVVPDSEDVGVLETEDVDEEPLDTAEDEPVATPTIDAAVVEEEERSGAAEETALPEQVVLDTRNNEEYGEYLVDSDGMSLYMFAADTQGAAESACEDACTEAWPPLTGQVALEGLPEILAAERADSFERAGGAMQITYNGWPLYYFVEDTAAGDVRGQGVEAFGGNWYLISPQGEPLEEEMAAEETGAADDQETTNSDSNTVSGDNESNGEEEIDY